ncbi:gamma-glutamylcyclotransferase [Massilia glaciei]|uniref:gamma-glutamylcyclotransferase n=1 Tax=Massilia glaciei TaxID=1524097 RepID=UPI0015E7E9BD|nr:gamma-glutamylcyclotransferase [Massilia glaciei]
MEALNGRQPFPLFRVRLEHERGAPDRGRPRAVGAGGGGRLCHGPPPHVRQGGRDGSAKCDCEPTGLAGARVYGVVYSVGVADKAGLDRAEGLGNGYAAAMVDVVTEGAVLTACTYFATRKDAALRG